MQVFWFRNRGKPSRDNYPSGKAVKDDACKVIEIQTWEES